MKVLQVVVIAVVAIMLCNWTLTNLLSGPVVKGDGVPQSNLLEIVRDSVSQCTSRKQFNSPPDDRKIRRLGPKGSNYYGDFHDSDIHSRKTNLSKFFEVEPSIPDTNVLLQEINQQSGSCSGDAANVLGECVPSSTVFTDVQSGSPMRFALGSDGHATMLPDQWSYQDEKVMNGGLLDGVRAYDTEMSDHVIYPSANPESWTDSYPYQQSFAKY